jgi:CDP-diacylglycerol--glycerol-3-phosphate 3-phosphatidyltransferase
MLRSVPNLLSMLRFPLAAGFLAAETTGVRLALLGMASASDLLDGWWARRFGRTTRLGALLDPVADKVFMLAAFTAFVIHGEITAGQWAVLLTRDVAIAIGAAVAWLVPGLTPIAFTARMSGKIVTVLQLTAILMLTVTAGWTDWVVLVVGWASIASIADYTLALAWALERRD